jgi:hypothetical protein
VIVTCLVPEEIKCKLRCNPCFSARFDEIAMSARCRGNRDLARACVANMIAMKSSGLARFST